MKKHLVLGITIIILVVLIPLMVYASGLTLSFGGKVLMTTVPDVNCQGAGTGPVVLISNLTSVGSAALSATSRAGQNQQALKTMNTVRSIYGILPFYAQENLSATPQSGQWILGRADIVPDFSTCALQIGQYKLPFPVRDTSNYRTSGML